MQQCEMDFSGRTYEPAFDRERLNAQQKRVFSLMADGQWRTLDEIRTVTKDPEASISARLRDLRNKYGLTVDRRRRGDPKQGLSGDNFVHAVITISIATDE